VGCKEGHLAATDIESVALPVADWGIGGHRDRPSSRCSFPGAASWVLANRFSGNPANTVLLLEWGGMGSLLFNECETTWKSQ